MATFIIWALGVLVTLSCCHHDVPSTVAADSRSLGHRVHAPSVVSEVAPDPKPTIEGKADSSSLRIDDTKTTADSGRHAFETKMGSDTNHERKDTFNDKIKLQAALKDRLYVKIKLFKVMEKIGERNRGNSPEMKEVFKKKTSTYLKKISALFNTWHSYEKSDLSSKILSSSVSKSQNSVRREMLSSSSFSNSISSDRLSSLSQPASLSSPQQYSSSFLPLESTFNSKPFVGSSIKVPRFHSQPGNKHHRSFNSNSSSSVLKDINASTINLKSKSNGSLSATSKKIQMPNSGVHHRPLSTPTNPTNMRLSVAWSEIKSGYKMRDSLKTQRDGSIVNKMAVGVGLPKVKNESSFGAYDQNITQQFYSGTSYAAPHVHRRHALLTNKQNTLTTNQSFEWNTETGNTTERITLYIGGLFELTGNKYGGNGHSELLATQMAISHVNQFNIIPGYSLELLFNDSQCDPGVGTDAFYDLIYRKSKESSLMMMVGGACNEVTKTLAEIVSYWNLVMISYAADSPALSEREKYRTFFRMALGHSALDPPRRMLLEHFRWKKVAVFYEELEALSLAFNTMRKDFASHDITVTSAASFKNAALESPAKLQELKEQDVRIIVAGFSEPAARTVFCEAYKLGLTGARYVWILVGGLRRQWWHAQQNQESPCTVDELSKAVDGIFMVFGLNGMLNGETSIGNLTYAEFLGDYNSLNSSHQVTMFTANSYDTVWTIALAIRNTLRVWEQNGTALPLHQLNYSQLNYIKDGFIDSIESLTFSGVSGPVSFAGSDREGISVVYQLQDGNYTPVALHKPFSSHLNFDCDICRPVIWAAGKIPKDEQTVVLRMKVILPSVFYTALTFCMCGILMAIFFLCYNLYYRRLKFIKLSSPKLNNVAVIGCILVYCDVILLGLDDAILTDHAYSIVCSARAFLLSSGFSLAFGAMFAKTFRVHRIFTRANRGLVKSRLIRDSHLLVIIGVLLVMDMALVCTWVVVDPMNRQVYNLTRQVSDIDPNLVYQDQLTSCFSDHLQKWLGAFYTYKGLLLVFGVYMAWETRHVKIPALNDSQYIGMNVYNVVIMAVCVVVISNIVSTRPNLAYAMVASFMVLSTTVTLCLLFVPKICAIVASRGNPIVASSGILVDRSNTRRFVFDDRREVLYRAEVQNRVYKRELVELNQKISRLERLLDIPLHPIPRLTEELLYLLPDTRADMTSQLRRGRRKPLEWCYSISDGGEGVTWSLSETEDLGTDSDVPSNPSSSKCSKGNISQSRKICQNQGLVLHDNIRSGKGSGKNNIPFVDVIDYGNGLMQFGSSCTDVHRSRGLYSTPLPRKDIALRESRKTCCCGRLLGHRHKCDKLSRVRNLGVRKRGKADMNYNMMHQSLDTLKLPVPIPLLIGRIDQSNSLPEIFDRAEMEEQESQDLIEKDKQDSETSKRERKIEYTRSVSLEGQSVSIQNVKYYLDNETVGDRVPILQHSLSNDLEEDSLTEASFLFTPSQSLPAIGYSDSLNPVNHSNTDRTFEGLKMLGRFNGEVFDVSNLRIISVDDVYGDDNGNLDNLDQKETEEKEYLIHYRSKTSTKEQPDTCILEKNSCNTNLHPFLLETLPQNRLDNINTQQNRNILQPVLSEKKETCRRISRSVPRIDSLHAAKWSVFYSEASLTSKPHETPKHLYKPDLCLHHKNSPASMHNVHYHPLHQTNCHLEHSSSFPSVPTFNSSSPSIEKCVHRSGGNTPYALPLPTSWQSCSAIEPWYHSHNLIAPLHETIISHNLPMFSNEPSVDQRETTKQNYCGNVNNSPVTYRALNFQSSPLMNSELRPSSSSFSSSSSSTLYLSSSSSSSMQEEILTFTNIRSAEQFNLNKIVFKSNPSIPHSASDTTNKLLHATTQLTSPLLSSSLSSLSSPSPCSQVTTSTPNNSNLSFLSSFVNNSNSFADDNTKDYAKTLTPSTTFPRMELKSKAQIHRCLNRPGVEVTDSNDTQKGSLFDGVCSRTRRDRNLALERRSKADKLKSGMSRVHEKVSEL